VGRKLFVLVLVWALVATGLVVSKSFEVSNLEKKLETYKKYASENSTEVARLKRELNSLKKSINYYRSLYSELEKDIGSLKRQLNLQNETIANLKKELEAYKGVPYDYYFCKIFPRHNNTLSELKAFMSNLTIPSNLTDKKLEAFLEWALKNAGFDAHIAYGEIEDEKSGDEWMDTWIVVFLKDGVYYIDKTPEGLKIFNASEELEIEHNGKEMELEYEPSTIFKDIYSVIMFFGNPEEWSWWKDLGFPPKLS